MRKKEKKFTILAYIVGALLVATTFSIQYFDSQIQDVNKNAILKQGRLNNDALLLINYLQTYYQYSIYEALNTSITFFNDNMDTWRTEEIKQIFSDYKNSNITDKEAISRFKNVIYSEIEKKATEYENHHFELENITYGNLNLYKNLASDFQIILIISNPLIVVMLYNDMKKENKRIVNLKERENNTTS